MNPDQTVHMTTPQVSLAAWEFKHDPSLKLSTTAQ